MHQCKGAIFDMDGLLFDTEHYYQETWIELADEMGVTLEEPFAHAIAGTSGIHMIQVLEKYFHTDDGETIAQACRKRIREKLSVHVPVKKGAEEILAYFKEAGIPTIIASSSNRRQIESNLAVSGLKLYFSEIICGAEVTNGKPAPDIFLKAAEKIGCRPEECFVFEDSENGVKAGIAAGCMTVMVPDLVSPGPQLQKQCFLVCQDLLEARDRIKVSGTV